MLPRVLEPEVMDSAEEAGDYNAMDHSAVNQAFVADFLKTWDGRDPVLDVGTGTALIPLEFCRQSPRGQVLGIDLAPQMLRVAEDNIRRAGSADRLRVEVCDAKAMPYPDGHFGAVISNSIVHHIPEPARVLGDMVRVTAPGGTVFVRDLLRPDTEPRLRELVQTYAGRDNGHQQKMFGDSLRAALRLAEVRDLVATLGFDPEEVRQTTDRHWTWSTRKP